MEAIVATLLAVVFGAMANYVSEIASRFFRSRVESTRKEVTEIKKRIEQRPKDIESKLELAQANLDQYVADNLVQLGFIFRVSIIVMSLGFAMIVGGIILFIYFLYNYQPIPGSTPAVAEIPTVIVNTNTASTSSAIISTPTLVTNLPYIPPIKANTQVPPTETNTQVQPVVPVDETSSLSAATIPGILATIAGIITEFIGATFLLMYQSAVKQSMSYVKTLERINAVGMAVGVIKTIPDDQKELKDKTLSEIAKLILTVKITEGGEGSEDKGK